MSVFAAVGAQPFFDRLVEHFYERVAHDEVLLPLYPDPADLTPARERLALFLGQYWGGPSTYSQRRGHPRLRMRHGRFPIGEDERDRWLEAMGTALEQTMAESDLDPDISAEVDQRMREYFAMAAGHLVNRPG